MTGSHPIAKDWSGNRVILQALAGTGLTLLQWYRPWNGALRGARILDTHELDRLLDALGEHLAGRRPGPRRDHLAGRPLDLERLLAGC